MVLLENNTLEKGLVDLSEGELHFTITDEDICKGMALLQQDEQEQSKEAEGDQDEDTCNDDYYSQSMYS